MLANSALKKFCLRNHCAANVFLVIGIFQFVFTIWLAIEHQQTILHWLFPNILGATQMARIMVGHAGVHFALGSADTDFSQEFANVADFGRKLPGPLRIFGVFRQQVWVFLERGPACGAVGDDGIHLEFK